MRGVFQMRKFYWSIISVIMPAKAKPQTKETPSKEVQKETKKSVTKSVSKFEAKAPKETKKVDDKNETKPKAEVKKTDAKKKLVAKSTKGAKKAPKAGEKEKKPKRSFKAIYENVEGKVVMQGRYCGAKPKQAACKALTGICKLFAKNDSELEEKIFFAVRETTRKSRNKLYFYSGQRVVLDEPITLEIADGKKITYKYNSIVNKANSDDCTHLLNYEVVDADEDEDEEEVQAKAEKVAKAPKKEKSEKEVKPAKETKVVKESKPAKDSKPAKKDDKKKPAKK